MMRAMGDNFEQQAIISGIGISRVGRKTGIGDLELTIESSLAAIADAGLEPKDIDGIASLGETPVRRAAAALGIEPTWTGGMVPIGGLLSPVVNAAQRIAEGRVRHVLVYRTVQMMGGSMAPSSDSPAPVEEDPGEGEDDGEGLEVMAKIMGDMSLLLAYHGYAAPIWLSMHAKRHMELYGTTKEQLGWLAINSRRNAGLNERAVYRDAITMDDYLGARPISEPFGLLDCDVPIDGSIAVVVSTADFAPDCANPALHLNAVGGAPDAGGGWWYRPDYPNMAATDAAKMMWSRTDLRPADIDFAQLYDGFTFLTFAWLEALGICGTGESGPFVEGASRIALEGEFPVNTYGGQLSAGRMHGYWVLHEACVQLRGQGGARQIAKPAEVAVVANGGGPIAGCMLLTR
jgi:acetyl-CoA acetyltransferase